MSTRGSAEVSAAELYSSLQLLASRLTAQGHPLEAIKCYVAMLTQQSLLPSDEASARLRLGQLLLEHTLNVQDARLNMQKAEMLVMPLPGQHLLKCEVLAALAATHQSLGETDFQRRCYSKGLEVCKDPAAPAADRRCLAEWSIYLHLHAAESMVAKGQAEEAVQQVGAAAAVAASQGLLQQQVLCHLFHLQLAVMQFDRQAVSSITSSVTEVLQQLEAQVEEQQQQGQEQLLHLVQLKLHFLMLQFMFLVQSGNFKELQGDPKEQQDETGAAQAQSITEQMEELLQQLSPQGNGEQQQQAAASAAGSPAHGQPQPYEWLPLPMMAAAVYLLAAVVDKNSGKQKQGQARIGRGLQVLDAHLKTLLLDRAAAADAPAQSKRQQELRACLALRLMLLEARQQLHLLCSNFAAARADAAESISVQQQFPKLLAGLEPMVHLQAGLYAQGVGAAAAAAGHFMAAARQAEEQGDLHLAADARHQAVLCYVADNTRESVAKAREVMGITTTEGDTSLGYGSRCLYHTAAGLLQLSGVNVGSDERADAKQHFSRALKMAHKHLHNHQVVSQLLMMMAPLQLVAADASGAKTMLSSCVQLSHGASDLHTQVSALSLMQQQLSSEPNGEEAARNRNYVARKDEELSGRIQEAEANSQQHHIVLAWGLK